MNIIYGFVQTWIGRDYMTVKKWETMAKILILFFRGGRDPIFLKTPPSTTSSVASRKESSVESRIVVVYQV